MLTVFLLTLGVGMNGAIYSGFKINHLDITPRFAGILMAFTNCTANLAGLLAPIIAGILIDGKVSSTQRKSEIVVVVFDWVVHYRNKSLPYFPSSNSANNGPVAKSILHCGRCIYCLRNILQFVRFG